MHIRLTRSLVALASVAALLVMPASAQFRTGTLTVPIYVTATDDEGRLVANLEEEDFEVYDNGRRVSLTLFENKNTPITVVVMLDTSGSMTLILDRVKAAAEQFLIRMLPEDTGRVGAFSDKIQFLPEDAFTSDRDELIRSLKDLDFGYPTRLWDAIDESIRKLEPMQGRKVTLVFTDGTDTASRRDLDDVMQAARAKEIMVYAIGLATEIFNGQSRVRSSPDRGLKKLAEETGGGFFLLKKEDELGPTFTQVAQELHSQYILGFSPATLDGKVHKLEVKVGKPGVKVRARKSYVATKAESGAGEVRLPSNHHN
ncbi:MAG: VWA domain-containing protein [Vicinamibacterales bacterium]